MGLRRILDDMAPQFQKGGRYEKFYALYEAVDTAFYSPSRVTVTGSHVRDGVDLKRVMITVWIAAFPAMFYGMYNVGFQATSAMANMGLTSTGDWHAYWIEMFSSYNPASVWDCVWYGAVHYIPIYAVVFIVGGFWEVLFATIRRHEINEGFFCYFRPLFADCAARYSPLAGCTRYQLRRGCGQGSLWRYRQELPESGPGWAGFSLFRVCATNLR